MSTHRVVCPKFGHLLVKLISIILDGKNNSAKIGNVTFFSQNVDIHYSYKFCELRAGFPNLGHATLSVLKIKGPITENF